MTTKLILLIFLLTFAVGSAQAEDERPIRDIRIAHEFVDCWTAIQYLKLTVGASAGEDSSVAKSYMARNADRIEKALIGAIQFYWKHLTDSGADRDDFEENRQRLMAWFDYDADNRALPKIKPSMATAMTELKASVESGSVSQEKSQGGVKFLEQKLNDEYCEAVFNRRIDNMSMEDYLQPYTVRARQRQADMESQESQER